MTAIQRSPSGQTLDYCVTFKERKATLLLAQLRNAVREVFNKCPFQNKATLYTYLTSRSATFPLLAQLKGQLRGKSSRLHSCLTQRAVSYVLVLAQLKKAVREIFIVCRQKRRPRCIRIWQGSQPRFISCSAESVAEREIFMFACVSDSKGSQPRFNSCSANKSWEENPLLQKLLPECGVDLLSTAWWEISSIGTIFCVQVLCFEQKLSWVLAFAWKIHN